MTGAEAELRAKLTTAANDGDHAARLILDFFEDLDRLDAMGAKLMRKLTGATS